MFNNLNQEAESHQEQLYYLGVVVENNDPERAQRIKVNIPNKMEDEPSKLDWIGPISRSPFGVGQTFGTMAVPALHSVVVVYFQGGNIKYGLHEGSAISVNFKPHPELLINYPRRYGFCDPAGNYMYIDYTPDQVSMHLYHKSGTNFDIDNDGNVVGHVVKDFSLTVDGNTSITTHKDTKIETDGNTSILTHKDTSITTDGDTSITSVGDIQITSSGDTYLTAIGPTTVTSDDVVTVRGTQIHLNP